jgi:hypothetical protein
VAGPLLVAQAACTGDDGEAGASAARTEDTTTTVGGTAAPRVALEAGQCGAVDRVPVGGVVDPASVKVVPCAQPHDLEVAAVLDHSAAPGAEFPGDDALAGYATEACLERFDAYVGAPYAASRLDVAFVAPGAEAWEDGDRGIACLLYDMDFAPLTGSVRGTGT